MAAGFDLLSIDIDFTDRCSALTHHPRVYGWVYKDIGDKNKDRVFSETFEPRRFTGRQVQKNNICSVAELD